MTRRRFLIRTSLAAGAIAMCRIGRGAAAAEIPTCVLGRTTERVPAVGVGRFHIGRQEDEAGSIRILRRAVSRGIRLLDDCWNHDDGAIG